MAKEITITAKLSVTNGSLKISRGETSRQVDQAAAGYAARAQVIGNSAHEALDIGSDVSAAGCYYLRNLDATNYVTIGVDVSGTYCPLLKLLPGEEHVGRFAINAPYAKANAASVKLDFCVLEA